MASGSVDADSFELTGAGASVTYDLGTGQFEYRGPTRPHLDNLVEVTETVAPLDTSIGRLVTVVLQASKDSDTDSFTVLLPRVILPDPGDGSSEAAVETVAVFTTTRSSIGGPNLLEGAVQVYASAPMSGTARRARPPAPCRFTAVLTRELPGPGVLQVDGECTLPSTGFQVSLVRQVPQGVNPDDLLLNLVVIPPADVVAPVLTTYPVSYQEVTDHYFDTVTILPDGPSVKVDIIT